MSDNKIDVLALQETHCSDDELGARGHVPGFQLVGSVGHRVYGIATYVRLGIGESSVTHESCDDNIFILAVKVAELTIVNLYKPPNIGWPNAVLPTFQHPCIYAGDFNSHHSQWGYNTDDENGTNLSKWAEDNNLFLIYDAKDASTFYSARWNRGYSPDLSFCSCDSSLVPIPARRKVLGTFPHSQHRPVVVSLGIQIPLIQSYPLPRWNFGKANWGEFTKRLDDGVRFIKPVVRNYDRFMGLVTHVAKQCIPRGVRKEYVPGWNQECEDLYADFNANGNPETANLLLNKLDEARKDKWVQAVENMDFTHSSRKAWSLLRKLSSGTTSKPAPTEQPSPDAIAKRLVKLSKFPRHPQDKKVTYKLNAIKRSQQQALEVSRPFTPEELEAAVDQVHVGKAAGLDGMFPEFVKNFGPKAKAWLLTMFNEVLATGILPKAFKRSKVIAVLKPGKCPKQVDSYRPITLLSVTYKLLERLVYNRISPILNANIPPEQAGFRPERSCCDQVLALTAHIENGFEQKKKTAVALIDLTGAYDTVWKKGLLYKVYKLIPCPVLLRLLNSILSDRLIQVHIGSKKSKFKQLKNGLPQGSVLSPLLFNVYTADLPATQSRKCIYADDIALAYQDEEFEETEQVLTSDLAILADYFKTWKLQPNPAKTEVTAFHLNNRRANYKLNISFDGTPLPYNEFPKYLGVTLDRSLTYRAHIKKTAAKVSTRANIVQKLAGTSWGANAKVLRTSALSLVYSAAEYCAPVWLNSAHVREIDVKLNNVMRTISGTLMATPTPWLPVLCNIPPPSIRRKVALTKEYSKIMANHSLPIHQDFPPPRGRLKSRRPPLRLASQLCADTDTFSAGAEWEANWRDFDGTNRLLVNDPTGEVPGMSLSRKEWVRLNRFRTGVGRCNDWKFKWGQTDDPFCDCGLPQTMKHIVEECPLRSFEGGMMDLHNCTPEGLQWMRDLDLNL